MSKYATDRNQMYNYLRGPYKDQPVVEEMSFEAIVDDARLTTDDGHPMITIAHLQQKAQVN